MDPLNTAKLIERSAEVSPAGYLTIISILQGVAAGILAEKTYSGITSRTAPGLVVWTQSIALLLILVFVFHFYTATAAFTRWPPSFLDALLPFLIGGFEVPPAFLIGRILPWSVSVGVLCGVGAFGLWTTGISATEAHFDNVRAYYEFHRILRETAIVIAVVAMLAISSAVLAGEYPVEHLFWGLGASGVVIIGVGVMAFFMERRLCNIYHLYGVPRPFFI